MQKQCFKCKKTKSVELFYKHPETSDGYLGKCKSCTKKDVKKRYKDPESKKRIVEYERNRNKTLKRKIKRKEYQIKRRKNRPGVVRANYAVSNAIRDGRLLREPCVLCGNKKSQAHHPDYRSPLKVVWLCFKHHRELHGQKPF